MDLQRRRFLALSGFTLGGVAFRGTAFAQSRADVTTAAITLNRSAANELLAEVHAKGSDLNFEVAKNFASREFLLRKQLFDVLTRVPPSSRIEYVLQEHRDLAEAVQREQAPLVPEVELIVLTPPKPAAGCEESLASVIVDVCLKTLGFNEDVQAVMRVAFEKSPEFNTYVDQVGRSIGMRDGEQAVDAMMQIIRLLASERFRKRLEAVVGAEAWKRISRQLTVRIAAKFVPFVGWIYMIIAVSTAVYVNRDRLVTAAKCRGCC